MPAHLRNIGYVPQDGALFPHLSVAQNIGFGIDRDADGSRQPASVRCSRLVELEPSMLARRPDQLSGGQQQRVALARALARKPKLMLLDEPFSSLDTGLRESMRKAVARVLQAASITTILVTHDQTEALTFADQVAMLRGRPARRKSARRMICISARADRDIARFLRRDHRHASRARWWHGDVRLGRVAVEPKHGRSGRRPRSCCGPEQLRLTLCDASTVAGECYGRVTDIEFGGAASMIAVVLEQIA